MNDIQSHLDQLAAMAHPEGGWGYHPDQPAHFEPTCYALLALDPFSEKHQGIIDKALSFLDRCATKDGIYRLERGRDEAVWPTALVLFTFAALGRDEKLLRRATEGLLKIRGRETQPDASEEIHDIDLSLMGWPWGRNNFSWAEPTAWACFALLKVGRGEHPRAREGRKLLMNRTFEDGGINYGNRLVFGRPLEPEPGPTAVALLALQHCGDEEPVRASVRYLQRYIETSEDSEHLCKARLALLAHREQPGVEESLRLARERIVEAHRQRPEVSWTRPSCLREALTALALGDDEKSPFVLPKAIPAAEPITVRGALRDKKTFGERVRDKFRGLAVKALDALRPLPPQTRVHIAPVEDYNADLADVVGRQYEAFRERVPLRNKRVVLKPNLVEYHRDKVINTHPNVVAAAIELCRREGASEVIVAEGPGHWRNVEHLVAESGLGDVLRHYKVPFIDLNHDEPVKRPNLGRLTKMPHLYLSQTIDTADVVISLPKLKTHHWAVATLSLKNLFGTLPGICYGWPKNELHWRGIDNSIVDIALTRTPDLAIVDGIIGMEGDGPLNGEPKPMGLLVMGCDLVAVDATCCRLMQLNPEKIGYLVMGSMKKLGLLAQERIEQIGEKIEDRAKVFETLEHFKPVWMNRGA